MSNARDKANIPALNFSSTGIDDNATSTAITIDSSEKIGVGSTTPSSDAWTGARSLVIKETDATKDNGIMIISSSTTNNGNLAFADTSGGGFSDIGGLITYLHNGDSFRFMTANTERMRLNSTGLGIGTSTPDELLTVALSGSTGTYFEAGGTTDNSNARRLTFTSSTTTNAGDTHTLNAESGTGNIAFATFNTERMRILKDGKIAINNTTPDTTLHIGNSTDNSEYITLQSSGDKRLTFKGASVYKADIGVYEANHNDLVLRAGSSAGIRFVTNNENFNGNTNPIRIDTNGNLGIGVTNPSSKLQVSGTVTATAFQGDGSALTGVGGSGRILQTVGASDTTTRSTTSTSMGGSPSTGLDINITPSSSSSKILVLVNAVGYSDANGGSGYYTIYRDSTDLGNLNRGLAVIVNDASVNTCVSGVNMKVIDTPNTTSSVNYKVVFRAQGGGTAYLGYNLMRSYIYALEIGA